MVPVSQGSLGREDMAEATCGFSVVSPLSIFVALRGPPLKLEEDSEQKPCQERSIVSKSRYWLLYIVTYLILLTIELSFFVRHFFLQFFNLIGYLYLLVVHYICSNDTTTLTLYTYYMYVYIYVCVLTIGLSFGVCLEDLGHTRDRIFGSI